MIRFYSFTPFLLNAKTGEAFTVLFGVFGEFILVMLGLLILGSIAFIVYKVKLNSVKSKFKRNYGICLPAGTKLDYSCSKLIESSYGNRTNYFVFKFKKEPTSVIENFISMHLKEGKPADEIKVELKKYFDCIVGCLGLIDNKQLQKYLPNWENEMIWNDGVFPAVYYPDTMEMIVCITKKE